MIREKYIECGKIVNTHGVKGMLKVETWCNSLDDFLALGRVFIKKGDDFKEHAILNSQAHKTLALLQLDSVSTLDEAMLLKGSVLYALRDDFMLEDGDFFIADIIGATVLDADSGKEYGVLKDIFTTVASDIYVVATSAGDKMFPAVDEFLISVDADAQVIKVRPIEGMFD